MPPDPPRPQRRPEQKERPREDFVLDVDRDEADDPEEITLDREDVLRDLKELQELSIERASGRTGSSDEDQR